MEFPSLGKNCEKSDCNRLDFLPIKCNFCSEYFCSEHSPPDHHSCAHLTAAGHTEKAGNWSLWSVCGLTYSLQMEPSRSRGTTAPSPAVRRLSWPPSCVTTAPSRSAWDTGGRPHLRPALTQCSVQAPGRPPLWEAGARREGNDGDQGPGGQHPLLPQPTPGLGRPQEAQECQGSEDCGQGSIDETQNEK